MRFVPYSDDQYSRSSLCDDFSELCERFIASHLKKGSLTVLSDWPAFFLQVLNDEQFRSEIQLALQQCNYQLADALMLYFETQLHHLDPMIQKEILGLFSALCRFENRVEKLDVGEDYILIAEELSVMSWLSFDVASLKRLFLLSPSRCRHTEDVARQLDIELIYLKELR